LEEEINQPANETNVRTNTPEGVEVVDKHATVLTIIPVVDSQENNQDNISSDDSDFVDNTQIGYVTNEVIQDPVNNEQIPLLVQNDIHFLKESWANLAEMEDQTALPVPTLNLDKPPDINLSLDVINQADIESPTNTDNDGFKFVASRTTTRIEKAKLVKSTSLRNSSITRSKVGSSKPSK
jgi:hypothetical protein